MGGFRSVSFLSASTIFTFLFAQTFIALTSGLNQSVILISFDGLGWEFVGSKRANTPNFDLFASGGVKAKNLFGVHPVKTFPVHTTFMTGLYPESHGIVDNKFWDPLYMEKFIMEHDCSNFDAKFYNESEPIWLTMQKQGRRTGAYYWPGSTSYSEKPAFYAEPFCYLKCEDYKGPKLEYLRLYLKVHCFFNWAKPFQKRIDTVLEWLVSENPPQLVMLYFEQPDMAGHKNGPHSATYVNNIEAMDRDVLGYLVERLMTLQLMDKTNVILLSDHGIIETKYTHQIRIHDYINPDSYFKNIAAREHIWPKPGKLNEIYAKLNSAENPHLKVYKKEQIPDVFHWKNHRRIPPIYLVAEEGWLIRQDWNPLAEGKWIEGTHGWPPTENSAGIFYARGPAFKEGYTSKSSKRAIDVYALLCYLVGVKPLPNNGTMDNMLEFLKKSPASHRERSHVTIPALFTPTTTKGTSAQTGAVNNQWYIKGNQTRNDIAYSHADTTTTETTASSILLDQRKTDKEKQERSRSFVLQTPDQHHAEVKGNTFEHKSQSSPQKRVKVAPTVTTLTNYPEMQQTPSVLPQTSSISAMGVMSMVGSLNANGQFTKDSQKRKTTILSSHKTLTSEMSRSSDMIQNDLIVMTSSLITLDSKSSVTTMTLSVLTVDSNKPKSTPVLLDTPILTSEWQRPFRTTSTMTISIESYINPTVMDAHAQVNTDEHNVTLSNVPLHSPILSKDVQHFLTTAILTTSKESYSSPSSAADTSINTYPGPLVLSKNSNFEKSPILVETPLWTFSTKTLKTLTETNDPQLYLLRSATLALSTKTVSFVSTTTLTKLTKINLRTTLAPIDTIRVTYKVMLDGKELDRSTNALERFISGTLTQNYEVQHVSADDLKYSNAVRTTKRSETTESEIQEVQDFYRVEVKMTSSSLLQHQMTSNAAVPETQHTTKNTLGKSILRMKQLFKSSVLIISSVQVSSSEVSSSSVIRTSSISSNLTTNNMSTVAFNSSMTNNTKINTKALIECPPYEEEENYKFTEETNVQSSTRATIVKPFSYLEAVMVFIIVKLINCLCTQ